MLSLLRTGLCSVHCQQLTRFAHLHLTKSNEMMDSKLHYFYWLRTSYNNSLSNSLLNYKNRITKDF